MLGESFAFLADEPEPPDVESVLLAVLSATLDAWVGFGVCGSAALVVCAVLPVWPFDVPIRRARGCGPATVVRLVTDPGDLRAAECTTG